MTTVPAAAATPEAQAPQAVRPNPRALRSNLDLMKHLGSLQWLSAAQQKRLIAERRKVLAAKAAAKGR